MNKNLKELVDCILEWWEEHQYDCHNTYEEEYENDFDDEPIFVVKAKELKEILIIDAIVKINEKEIK